MTSPAQRAVAIVGVGAIFPDAPDADAFWANVRDGHYAISDVDAARWDPALYYDADPKAPDMTYSTIGGWVREWDWNPLAWKLPIPPRVGDGMDDAQKWAVACTRTALIDYGWPERPLDLERTAVVLGNAMAGEKHYLTCLRLAFPELARDLDGAPSFAALAPDVRAAIASELHARMEADLPPTNEDTMPGELGNCLAGRVANLFNLRGPNFVVDAACASAMAAMDASIQGLLDHQFDAVITGGVDRNMGVNSFIKFCAIGALSSTGTRPYSDGADGFVMGEGAGLFLLKRLADAERDGDRIYAVVRGMAGSSDGKGKGLTAPNPIGQKLAIERAWHNSGLSPATCSLMEGHGTSTAVGDYVELSSLAEAFAGAGLAPGSIALGSVKSNIGHLKSAAGAAGMLKATLAIYHKALPPSLGFVAPNPNADWSSTPFAVNTELRDWEVPDGTPRVAGVSAFGFGGTNYHAVIEEYVPGRLSNGNGHATIAVPADAPAADTRSAGPPPPAVANGQPAHPPAATVKPPLRGAFLAGAADEAGLAIRLRALAESGDAPPPARPSAEALGAAERVCIDYVDAAELSAKARQALKAIESGNPAAWKALQGRGIFRGSGAPGKVAFLYTGQGSQYANMLAELRRTEPIVAATFDEADVIMRPLLGGRALSDIIFVGPEGVADAEAQLMRTEITQPAVLTVDIALTRLLAAYGIEPDLVMGHSLGEYGALVAAGIMSFGAALEAVSARGRGMANLTVGDPGALAAVSAPLETVERIIAEVDGYLVLANVNSPHQLVLGGDTDAVEQAVEKLIEGGERATRLPVSHAFHTRLVAGVTEPLRATLQRMTLSPARIPVVANVDGEFYPTGPGVEEQIVDTLARQVASPVQFIKGLHTLYDAGGRVLVETGPKRALWGFAADVLGDDVMTLFTNHPKVGELASFNHALCGLYAAGVGAPSEPAAAPVSTFERPARDDEPVVITGAAAGTPGTEKVFDDGNLSRLLHGEQFIHAIPARVRREIAERHITRLVKSEDGTGTFQTIDDPADVIKLAGRAGEFDLGEEFGIDADRLAALGRETQLAIAAGIDALRDAGIPLIQHYKDTTRGTKLPDKWRLPDALRDDTGVIFASAFPGSADFAGEMNAFWTERVKRARLEELSELRARADAGAVHNEIDRRIAELELDLERDPYHFDRRFLFRVLSMGHSQLAELIGARGPNTQINAACASTTQAISMAEDWIRAGRCRRVVIVAGDDVTSEALLPWVGSGFLASGAAATDELVEDAALPFDRRRHGMILGMGAAGIVVESAAAARERGVTPICEVLGAVTANSAFHGSRLDVEHIGGVMESLVRQAEARGVTRDEIAPETLFVSHETYTPARGGSAAAEISALRRVFGEQAEQIVVANTKGTTGHTMGVGVEDIVAIKALETGLVPAVPNFRDIDPELGALNLSKGGQYPVRYALRLAAGFGSQISMTLMRWTPVADGRHRAPDELGYEYRIADQAVWKKWLRSLTRQAEPQLEVVKRHLRMVDTGPVPVAAPGAAPAPVIVPVAVAPPVPVAVAAPVPPAEPVIVSMAVAPPMPVAVVAPVTAPEPVIAAPATTPSAPVAAAPTTEEITAAILEIVAAQTGYPADMLDPELDLEADLGIDTVKQAEMFAAVREQYAITRDDNLNLRDYPTLRHVVGFVEDRTGTTASPVPAPAAAAPPAPVIDPAPATTPSAPVAAAPTTEEITAAILEIVAAQTGYPADMLDPELDLEADLGIDTVKQAEMFAAVREQYAITRDDNLNLRDYPTLRHVVGFVEDRTGTTASPVPAPAAAAPPAPVIDPAPATTPSAPVAAAPTTEEITAAILEIVAAQTGYPADMLDPELDLEADLGIDTVKQAEMFAAVREQYAITRDDNLNLRDYPTLRHVVGFVEDRTGTTASPVPAPAAAAPPAPVIDPAPATTPSAPVAAAPTTEEITAAILEIVAAQTGYPADMLDPELDLEADLGIDTVKQAEMFAAVREQYAITRDDNLNLRDYPTLRHVVGFVEDHTRTTPAPAPAATATPPVPVAPAPAMDPLPDPGAFPRRVPVPVLRPPLTACVDTGVTLGAGVRVVLMPDQGGVAPALAERLTERGVEVLSLDPALAGDAVEARLAEWSAAGPIGGVYWLPALDEEGPLAALEPGEVAEALRVRVKLLAVTIRALTGGFLVSGTRLGGRHGYDAAGATSTLGGAVTGFTKALARERPEALVKAVDFASGALAPALADLLVEETLRDPGAIEIGHADELRWSVGLIEEPTSPEPGRALTRDTVFVVTGAAGSIVSAITADLAAASAGTFHLLDLVPAPDAGDPDLGRFDSDPDGLKHDLADRLRARGERPTPKLVDRELARIERAGAALAAVTAIEEAGGSAHWHQVDLTDADAVAAALAGIDRVDVLMHAAGLEISHYLPDKPQAEFDLVFDVKAGGWLNLLHALGQTHVGSAVVFSSIAGRFGNAGQTDYAAANDLLCKSVSQLRRGGTRGIALDWTAWADIGMASRGSIPKLMEAAGIDMLPSAAGVPVVRRELTGDAPGGEVVVAGALGVMLEERHVTGGLDPVRAGGAGPMTGRITAMTLGQGLTVRTELDPDQQPFLHDHRIDGTPVLPGVMGMEAFAEASRVLLDGWQVVALEDVDLLAPVKFYRDEPRTLELHAQIRDGGDGTMIADCELVGRRPLPGQGERETRHFTGRARLSRAFGVAPQGEKPESAAAGRVVVGHAELYRVYFHGPAYQVLGSAWRENGHVIGTLAGDLPPGHEPALPATLFLPRLIELCFQTLGVWEIGTTGRMWLPSHVDRVLRYAGADEPGPLWAVVTPRDGGADADVVDADGRVRVRLEGYRTIELPGGMDDDALAPLRDAMADR